MFEARINLDNLLEAEQNYKDAKRALDSARAEEVRMKRQMERMTDTLSKYIAEHGPQEIDVDGYIYKVRQTTPQGRLVVPDVEAVPDEWVKVEKKPKLKEIKDHIKETGEVFNWCAIEYGEPSVTYSIKKGG